MTVHPHHLMRFADTAAGAPSLKSRRRPLLGTSFVLFGVGFNVPYVILSNIFDYPDILRRPAGLVLDAFAAGGTPLVMTWYAFMAAALLFLPLVLAHATAMRTDGIRFTGVAIVIGVIAGVLQAIGLARWVFAVPALARAHTATEATPAVRASTETAFDILNAWGGMAIGEHLGQIFTALWLMIVAVGFLAKQGGPKLSAILAALSGLTIFIGSFETVYVAIGADAGAIAFFPIIGFGLFTLWLLVEGFRLALTRPAFPDTFPNA